MNHLKNPCRRCSLPLISSLIVLIILLVVFALNNLAPFGNNSLAVSDAIIQYLDLFAYLKNVLTSQNSLLYPLSETLGGNNFIVFSYYLASPFNFLVLFFNKPDLSVFYNLLALLKLFLPKLSPFFV